MVVFKTKSLISFVALRPISYARRMTLTVVVRPVVVDAFLISSTAVSSVSNSSPVQARLT